MASREDSCAEQLAKLMEEELRIDTLNEIKERLASSPTYEAAATARNQHFPLVFDCLNDSNKQQIDLACEVLTLCMSNLNLGESTNRYAVPLERALKHPVSSVKEMALTEIEKDIKNEATLGDLCRKGSLLSSVIRCIGDDDLAVAKKAMNIFVAIGKNPLGLRQLTSNDSVKVIHEVMSIKDVMRSRIYESMVDISKNSEECFKAMKGTGIFNDMLQELEGSDILLRRSILEILSDLILCNHGYNFIESSGVLRKQLDILNDAKTDPITLSLCEPGILKFLGQMAHQMPGEILSKYPEALDHLIENLECENVSILMTTYDTLASIGSSNNGKIALEATGDKMEKAIKAIVQRLESCPTETKQRALNCLENLLKVTDPTERIMSITSKWYHLLSDAPLNFILKYAKNPFFELRLAGFGLLHAIAEQNWGQQEICNHAGLTEFLMDRNSENKKECKEAKYNICCALISCVTMDHLTKKRLEAFIKEGPFFVSTITEVAIEGND